MEMIRLPRTDILLNICLRPPWRGNHWHGLRLPTLPEEAFGIKDLMEKYKKVQYDFHQGTILPIGEEPSGRSWTGFQSLCHSKTVISLFTGKIMHGRRHGWKHGCPKVQKLCVRRYWGMGN